MWWSSTCREQFQGMRSCSNICNGKEKPFIFSICAQGYTPFSKYLLLQPGKSWAGQPEPPVLPQDIGHFYPKMMVEGKRAALPHNHLIYCCKRTNIE